ncbi:hypothetical protein MNV49_004813 [Pseudohyphozyma bogoriensis]|nr:hypothetical protein MNV49_004813 [Pseudohyphozyma bogoriensis]
MSGYMSFVQLPGYPYPPQPPPPGMVYPGPPPPGLAANAYGYAPGHGHVNNQFLPLLPRPPPGTPTIPKLEKNDDELSLMLKKTLVVETMRDLATNGGLAIEAELKFAIEITLAQHQLPFQEPSANAPSQLRHMYSIFDGYRGFCRSNQVATLPLSPALVSIFLQPQLPQVRKIAYESFELYRQATSPVFYHYSTSPFIVKHNLSQSTFAMWMQAVAESHESLSSFRCLRDMAAPASASALPRIPKLEPGTRPRTGQLPAIAPAQPSTAISSAKLDLIKTNYQNTVAKGVVSTATSEGNVAPQKPPRPPRKRAKKPPPTLGTQEEEEAEEVEFMAAIEGFQKACAEYKVLKEQQEQAQEEAEPSEETLSPRQSSGLASPPLSEDPRRRSASNPAASGSTTTTSKKRTQEEEPVWKAAKKVQRVVEVVIPKPKAGTVVERSPPATKIVDLTESDGASSPRPSYHSPSSMATVTYNNGLYTPDYGEEASSTAAAVVASTTAPAWEQATTSYAAATLATSSSAAVVYTPATSASRATTTTRAAVVSSTTAQWQATTTSSSPAYSYSFAAIASTSSTTPAAASSSTSPASSSSSASSSAVNRSTTLTRPTVLATHAANSASSNSSSSSFKIVYLIPVFVILPLAVAFAAFCCYRSRKRSRSDKSWSAGSRSDGVLSPDEEKALVEGRFVTDGGDYDEKRGGGGKWSPRRNNDKQPRWSFVPQPLMRVISHSSDGHEGHSHEPQVDDVNFAAVPYNSLETPFIPPSKSQASIAQKRYLTPEEEEAQRLERGWGWGTQNRGLEPRRVARSASRSGSIVEGLSEGWKWASKKYKARSGGSHGSRRSGRTLGGDETSPSIYSPTVEGPYDGLEGEDAAEREAELDRLLAESRTGDSDLAKRFLSGRVTAADFPSTASVFAAEAQRQKQEQQGPVDNLTATPPRLPLRDPSRKASGAKPPPFALPTAPGQTHVSPKKSAIIRSTQSRNITPTKPGSGALIFAYDSPTRSTYTAPAPSAVIPANFRGIAPPPRSNTSTPIPRTSTATPVDPALLFSPPVGSVGSPMPAFEPGALKASESAFSLTGVVFAGEQTGPNALKQYANSRSREGSRERAEQTEKLRASAPSFSGAIAARAPTESKMSSRPHQPQAQPQPTASTLRPAKRESLGFNFAEPNLPRPLSHPSRVKSAVETLEARKNSTPPSPSTAVFPSSSQPRSTSPTKTTLTSTTPVKKYERPLGSGSAERSRVVSRSASSGTTSSTKLVAPPSSQKLSRSTTTREKEVDSDEEDTRNVGSLLLRRSRTSVHLGVLPPDSPTLSEIHGSGSGTASGGTSRSGHSSYSHSQSMSALASDANVFGHDDAPKPRRGPLPNAPVKRAVSGPRAMMQPPRGVSTAKATDPDSPSRNILGVSGGAGVSGGSGLEAMLRRSQAPELKSAMKK